MESSKKIIFCEYITSQNKPVNPAKIFELGPAGVNIKFFLPGFESYFPNKTKKFLYEIFRISNDSIEEYEDTVFTELNPANKIQAEFTFYKTGRFRIKIYDSKKKKLLNTGTILIKKK
jgi:hypothetical protein